MSTVRRTLVLDFGGEGGPLPARVARHLAPLRALFGVFLGPGDEVAGSEHAARSPQDLRWTWTHAPHAVREPFSLLDPWSWAPRQAEVDPARFDKSALPALRRAWSGEGSGTPDPVAPLTHGEVFADAQALGSRLATVPPGRYVLKPVRGSAGRGFRWLDLPLGADSPVPRFSEPHLLEHWRTRTRDLGAVGLLATDGALVWSGVHRQQISRTGGFEGIELGAGAVTPDERAALEGVLAFAARALHAAGHAGPFGVDAYAWRDEAAATHYEWLGEINARMTFGHVAHAHVAGLRAAGEAVDGLRLSLRADAASGTAVVPGPRVWHIAPGQPPRCEA